MTLSDLIIAVRDEKLNKDQLEAYRSQMSDLFAQMQIEMADLEKEEALFLNEHEGTAIARKISWKATKSGQRLIVLKRYCLATKELLRSLQSRLYSIY